MSDGEYISGCGCTTICYRDGKNEQYICREHRMNDKDFGDDCGHSCDLHKEKPGDDKLLKRNIEIPERIEGFLFTPGEDISREEFVENAKAIGSYFRTVDSGNKETFSTGMQRNSAEGKPRYDLIWRPGLKRVAELYARGAKIYGDRNWEKASTQEEMDRFDESLLRHVFQLLEGDRSEDHMAALIFNAFGREMVREKLNK